LEKINKKRIVENPKKEGVKEKKQKVVSRKLVNKKHEK
jgi:hypothetical protein